MVGTGAMEDMDDMVEAEILVEAMATIPITTNRVLYLVTTSERKNMMP